MLVGKNDIKLLRFQTKHEVSHTDEPQSHDESEGLNQGMCATVLQKGFVFL
jgi:hypothetical protein